MSFDVHIGYAEALVSFAGQGGFERKSITGGQTATNTVVVGQKVHAIVDYDDTFSMSWQWSTPIGRNIVNNYETNATVGVVTPFAPADELEFYYVTNHTHCGYGYLGATITAVDPNGFTHTVYDTQSYFIEAPTVASFTSVFASWNPAENPVGVRPWKIGPDPNAAQSLFFVMDRKDCLSKIVLLECIQRKVTVFGIMADFRLTGIIPNWN